MLVWGVWEEVGKTIPVTQLYYKISYPIFFQSNPKEL